MNQRCRNLIVPLVVMLTVNAAGLGVAYAQTPSGFLSSDLVTSTPLAAGDRSVVVLIHGWTGKSSQDAPPDAFADSDMWIHAESALHLRLAGTGVKLLEFHWERDASTGSVWNSLGTFTYPVAFNNATQAAVNAWANGDLLAGILNGKATTLRRVVFLAHSAGAWAAYRAATALLDANPYVVVNVVLLDPFIPNTGVLTTAQMRSLAFVASQDRLYRLENYYAIDTTDSTVGGGPGNATSQEFAWRAGDINKRIDYHIPGAPGDVPYAYGGPPLDLLAVGHSMPILFYADTVTAATPGSKVPTNLVNAPWNFLSLGFFRSLIYEGFLLPGITIQPLAPTQPVAAGTSISFTVSANRTSTYQWFKNGQPYPVTAPTLTMSPVAQSDAGVYVVRLKNDYGYAFSDQVVLNLAPPPSVVFSPASSTLTIPQKGTSSADFILTSKNLTAQTGANGPVVFVLACAAACPTGVTPNYTSLATLPASGTVPARVTLSPTVSTPLGTYTYTLQAKVNNILVTSARLVVTITAAVTTGTIVLTAAPDANTTHASTYCSVNGVGGVNVTYAPVVLAAQAPGVKTPSCTPPPGWTIGSITPASQTLLAGQQISFTVNLVPVPVLPTPVLSSLRVNNPPVVNSAVSVDIFGSNFSGASQGWTCTAAATSSCTPTNTSYFNSGQVRFTNVRASAPATIYLRVTNVTNGWSNAMTVTIH